MTLSAKSVSAGFQGAARAFCMLATVSLGATAHGHSVARPAAPVAINPRTHRPAAAYKPGKTLLRIAQVRSLSTQRAARSIPVQLTGVVTAVPGYRNSFFLQDKTAGISVDRTDDTVVRLGDRVLVNGTSGPGLFAPVVLASQVRVLGRGPPPHAPNMTLGDLFGGVQDSQWIQLRGVVRSATLTQLFNHPSLLLVLKLDGGSVNLQLLDFASVDVDRIVDSVISVRGVCASSGNEKRQFVGSTLLVPNRSDLTIEHKAIQDPFDDPVRPVEDVLKFGQWQHRVKVAGIVTNQLPGQALYLQDGDNGIRIESKSDEIAPPGTHVEAVGFPAMREYAPEIEDGLFRVPDPGAPVTPITPKRIDASAIITWRDGASRANYDMQLIQVEATLMEDHVQGDQHIWIMRPERNPESKRDGNTDAGEFDARMPVKALAGRAPVRAGSLLLLTGICTIHVGSTLNPVTFSLILRSPADIVVVKQGPWWTPVRGLVVLSIMGGLTCLVLLWVTVLRIRVEHQTRTIHESRERFRYLSEHDSLTGLLNRAAILLALDRQLDRGCRDNSTVTVVLADIDHFKHVNDMHGHLAGDAALRRFTAAASASVRRYDEVGRYGGEEFLLVLPGIPDQDVGDRLQALHTALSNLDVSYRQSTFDITCSMGAVVIAKCQIGMDRDSLLAAADQALYQAKQAGRNRVVEQQERVGGFSPPSPASAP